jgi:hypothetical protein
VISTTRFTIRSRGARFAKVARVVGHADAVFVEEEVEDFVVERSQESTIARAR